MTITVVGACSQCHEPILTSDRYYRQVTAWESPSKALSRLTPTGVLACSACRGDKQIDLFQKEEQ